MVCFLLADGAEVRGGEMTAPSSCAKPSHRSGPPARVCAGADTVSIATEAVYAIGRVQIGRGTLGGVATVSAGSAAGCVKGAIAGQQQTSHRTDLKYGQRRARVSVVGWEQAQDTLRRRERKVHNMVARRRFDAAS
ncbi:predicted protein [Postia placenta Mad-698-R]|nr:predicted protein [Postia placenta Mad-698-R]